MKRYKFLVSKDNKIKSYNGDCEWKIKEKKIFNGDLSMCNSGFHCSKTIYQAFSYVQGDILAEVEVGGNKIISDNKEVYSEMKILRAWKWKKEDSVALAIYSAELVLKNFEKVYPNDKRPREAIEAAKRYLKELTEENRSAAWSAAMSAESAAMSAKSAAWSAKYAAWSAMSAARSAKSAAIKKIQNWMSKRKLQKYD